MSNLVKNIFYVVIVAAFVYFLIHTFTSTPQPIERKEILMAIDSLKKENAILKEQQKVIDSTIAYYETKIFEIDDRIANIQGKTVIIKKYYGDKVRQSDNFTPTQVDSFLRNRYGY